MWTTAELKARAREKLKNYFFEALIVCFIVGLITGGGGNGAVSTGSSGIHVNTDLDTFSELNEELEWGEHVLSDDITMEELMEDLPHAAAHVIKNNPMVTTILAGAIVLSLIISLVLGIFVAPVIEVSKNRYFLESSVLNRGAGAAKLIWGFNRNYLNIVWTMFLSNLIILAGTLCCVIPGIYAAYCFLMVPYILAENPEMKAMDALRLSNEMMKGNKFGSFILALSFIGWSLLAGIIGMFTCGLGTYLVIPYIEATFAELYLELRSPFAGGLNGFGYPEYGPYGPAGSGNADYRYYPGGTAWSDGQNQTVVSAEKERETEINRSETDHVRGYYLNGVFYPYTEEELRAMEGNQQNREEL